MEEGGGQRRRAEAGGAGLLYVKVSRTVLFASGFNSWFSGVSLSLSVCDRFQQLVLWGLTVFVSL